MTDTYKCSIVIIPGAFTKYSNKERQEACSWLKPLVVATVNDTRVLYFLYDLNLNGKSIWEQLVGYGISLMYAVQTLHKETQVRRASTHWVVGALLEFGFD